MTLSPLLPASLQRHLFDDGVTDILVNHETEVWVERFGTLQRVDDLAPGVVDRILERILTPLGRRLDRLSPMVDARLPDGNRVCAVIAPIATKGTCAAFRIFRRRKFRLQDFASPSTVGPDGTDLIEIVTDIMRSGENVLVTGATGSGKTSLVATLLDMALGERLLVLEDTQELSIDHEHAVRLEARPATVEGRGGVTLDDLLRTALRLRPDRIVVGEVRGSEALTLVQALSTGHRGCLATVHANSALDGLHRLEVLALQGLSGWSITDVRRMVEAAVGYVIHMARGDHGQRLIDHIGRVCSTSTDAQEQRMTSVFTR